MTKPDIGVPCKSRTFEPGLFSSLVANGGGGGHPKLWKKATNKQFFWKFSAGKQTQFNSHTFYTFCYTDSHSFPTRQLYLQIKSRHKWGKKNLDLHSTCFQHCIFTREACSISQTWPQDIKVIYGLVGNRKEEALPALQTVPSGRDDDSPALPPTKQTPLSLAGVSGDLTGNYSFLPNHHHKKTPPNLATFSIVHLLQFPILLVQLKKKKKIFSSPRVFKGDTR